MRNGAKKEYNSSNKPYKTATMQNELTQPSPLLDADGKLTQVGWSRKPLLDCNLENARFHRFRWFLDFSTPEPSLLF